ncbi:MAG: hypothetical protein HY673_14385 [Chloroflexi bacterium]|nr:hypothetical protein [Chloroflexota bacterium]
MPVKGAKAVDNMSATDFIEIRFSGEGVKPETTKASDIADIIKAIESMLESYIFRDHPDTDKDAVIVGLVSIENLSVGLTFRSQIPAITIRAFEKVGEAVATGQYSELPPASLEALNTIALFTRRRQCTTDFIVRNGQRKTVATMTPQTKIERLPSLTGETTIYGQVIRVGGRDPKVWVELINGDQITCEASVDIVRKLGGKLYDIVGLSGSARWNPKSLALEGFTAKDITPYEETPLEDAFGQLAKVAGQYYADVNDVERYIASIRGSRREGE